MMRLWMPLLILLTALTGGCEVSKKVITVIADPEVPVGYPEEQASEITLSLLADHDINPNYSGEPTPTDVQLIYLTEDSKLLNTDYYQIANEPLDKLLNKNYIDHQDYTLEPGQFKTLKATPIDPKTQFIAVIAHYSDADSGEVYWLDITELEGTGQKHKILIHVRSDEVEIKKS